MNLYSQAPRDQISVNGVRNWSPIKQYILCALDPADLNAAVDEAFADTTNHVVAISPALPAPDEYGIAFTQTILYQERVTSSGLSDEDEYVAAEVERYLNQ